MANRVVQTLRSVVWFALLSLAFLTVGFVLALWWPEHMALLSMCGAASITCAVLSLREER